MNDGECVEFLRWALPRLRMRWPGFRKVRRQVCKRIGRRIKKLALENTAAYRKFLDRNPGEWDLLDACCRVTISRFYRGISLFDAVGKQLLPELATAAAARGAGAVRCWSAGCASGEEPYTLAAIWKFAVESQFPGLDFTVVATDADSRMLDRARAGRYEHGSLRDFPPDWLGPAFHRRDGAYVISADLARMVTFRRQDIRQEMPAGPFDLICCRNLVFTYFDDEWQAAILQRITARLLPGSGLVIGDHEELPSLPSGLVKWLPALPVYRHHGK